MDIKSLIKSDNSWSFAIWYCDSGFYSKSHVPWGKAETICLVLTGKNLEDAERLHKTMKRKNSSQDMKKVIAELFKRDFITEFYMENYMGYIEDCRLYDISKSVCFSSTF